MALQLGETTKAITQVIVDPVCGMNVPPHKKDLMATYRGNNYYFCAEACRKAFEGNPEKYLKPKVSKRKSFWGRYIERLISANRKQFGDGRPTCCR